jgi:hypothetical protein
MKIILLIYTLLFTITFSHAQSINGRVQNDEDGVPLPNVYISNLNHPMANATSDASGRYSIVANVGDSIRFGLLGYNARVLVFTGANRDWFESVALKAQSQVLDTVVIRRGLTKYQQDSLDRHQLYDKDLNYKPLKTKLPKWNDKWADLGGPAKINGPLSGLLDKRSKSSKRIKSFKEMYATGESQAFIDSRYSKGLVTDLTGLKDDSLGLFMQAYPMSYDYARTASDLEVKMWIKYNYKEWMQSHTAPASPAPKIDSTGRP